MSWPPDARNGQPPLVVGITCGNTCNAVLTRMIEGSWSTELWNDLSVADEQNTHQNVTQRPGGDRFGFRRDCGVGYQERPTRCYDHSKPSTLHLWLLV